MTEFGLVGTWSPDCTRPPGKGIRTTFAVPPVGLPIRSTIVAGDRFHLGATTEAQVLQARRIGEDRLRLILKFTQVSSESGAPIASFPRGQVETVVERVGSRINLAAGRYSQQTYEKCS
jgi:hypothetical protein